MKNNQVKQQGFRFDFLGIGARRAAKRKEEEEKIAAGKRAAEEEREKRIKEQEEARRKQEEVQRRWQQEARELFPRIFGREMEEFGHPREWECFLVETVIRTRAKSFKEACVKQEEQIALLKSNPNDEKARKLFVDISLVLETAKKDFWTAVRVAKNSGCSPSESRDVDLNYYLNLYQVKK